MAFATVDDYRARYDTDMPDEQLEVLLEDASVFIQSQPHFVAKDDEVQARALVVVTCAIVHRATLAGDLAGFEEYSETAVGISASASLYNPSGDFWLTKSEKRMLGISGATVGTIRPEVHPWVS